MGNFMKICLLSLLMIAIAGCASTQAQSPAPATNSTAAVQPAAQPTASQDREDRIKQSDAIRRSMGY